MQPQYSSLLQPPGYPRAKRGLVWRMGDGMVRVYFRFGHISKNTKFLLIIVSRPLQACFRTSFVKKSKNLKNLNFVKKFRKKRALFFTGGKCSFWLSKNLYFCVGSRPQMQPQYASLLQSPGSPRAKRALVLTVDGWWMDGWTDGPQIMFFGNISKNTHFFGLTVFGPLRRLFKTSFVKNSKVLKNFIYFLKFRTIFFSGTFSKKNRVFRQYLKKYSFFFSECFWSG